MTLGKWISDNIKTIVVFVFVVAVVLFFYNWTLDSPGKEIFEEALSQLPFIEFLYEIQKKVTKISYYDGVYDTSKIIIDFIKLFFSAPLYALCRGIVSRFLLYVPDGSIEEMEKSMKSPFYKFNEKIVDFILTVGSLIASSCIIDLSGSEIKAFFATGAGTATGIAVICALFVIYSVIYAYLDKKTVSFAVVKTVAFNVIPQVVNIYVTTGMYGVSYMMYQAYKLSLPFWLSVIILIAWCAVKDTLIKKVQTTAVNYRNFYSFRLSAIFATLYMYYGMTIACQAYCISAPDYSLFENSFVKMFFNFPAMPFFAILSNGLGVFETCDLTDSVFIAETVKLVLMSMYTCLISRLFAKFSFTLSFRGIMKWMTFIILQEMFVMMLYSFTLYIADERTSMLLLFFGAIWLASFVIRILMDMLNVITDLGFFLSNLLLESIVTGFVCVIFTYFGEKLFYLAPSDIPEVIIPDLALPKGFVITGCVIFVLLGGWFVSDYMGIEKTSKSSTS